MKSLAMTLAIAAVAAVLGAINAAKSQDWPARPVRIIIPFSAGGSSDIAARIIAQRLGDVFGQQFVVENRPGASGAIAAETVMHAPADGYTLLMGTAAPIAIAPILSKTSYDPVKDFVPISLVGSNPSVLVVNSAVPAQTLAEFIEYVRKRPNEVTYASSGVGTTTHLTMVLLQKRAAIQMIAVNYKGGTALVNDVIAGHVHANFGNLATLAPYVTSGALKLLAVSGGQRVRRIPQVPTLIESGLQGLKAVNWFGLMAPAGTPRVIVDRLAKEISVAVHDTKISERLIANGIDPIGNTPEQFAAVIVEDIALWSEAIKAAGLGSK